MSGNVEKKSHGYTGTCRASRDNVAIKEGKSRKASQEEIMNLVHGKIERTKSWSKSQRDMVDESEGNASKSEKKRRSCPMGPVDGAQYFLRYPH